jgi:DNA adenine methylase
MDSEAWRPVAPVRPAAPYIGGKRNLAARLVTRIEAIAHTTYAEAFVGMGGVFLRRRWAPKAEVINDVSGDVATFFRILQRHYTPFVEMLRYQVTGRREFERLARADPTTLTDLERAARFLYLQRIAFGGKVAGRNFGVSAREPAAFNVAELGPLLAEIHDRLAGVVIECLPYGELLRRYDHDQALFYLDPPYFGSESDYGAGVFGPDDFGRLAEQLRGLRGAFLLSINDVPEIRETFAGFDMEAVATTYTVSGGRTGTPAAELIISGRCRNAGLFGVLPPRTET